MPDNQLDKVRGILKHFDTAMLVTKARDQAPRARPMAIAHVDAHCGLWFFTDHTTAKVHEIESNSQVLIVCQDDHRFYLALSGMAELVSNREQARHFWKESFRTWFPGGAEDPDLVLIFVRAEEAEYWDNAGLKGMRYVFEAAKAYATGSTPKIQEGEQHGRVVLK